jgi:hypothetical protein
MPFMVSKNIATNRVCVQMQGRTTRHNIPILH